MIEAALVERIDQCPWDWEARIIYADLLEEAGETVLAWGQRWQAHNRAYHNSPEPLLHPHHVYDQRHAVDLWERGMTPFFIGDEQ